MDQKKKRIESALLIIIDLLCLMLSGIVAFQIRYQYWLGRKENWDELQQLIIMMTISTILNMIIDFNHHFSRRTYFEECVSVIKKQSILSVVWIVFLYMIHSADRLSRLVCFYIFVINSIFTYIGHLFLKQYLITIFKKSKYCNRMLVVTTWKSAEDTLANIIEYNDWSRILTGVLLLDKAEQQTVAGFPVVASPDNFIEYVTHHDIDEVFIRDVERKNIDIISPWIQELENMGITVNVNIDIFDIRVQGKKTLNCIGKYAVVAFSRNLFSIQQMFLKRTLDIIGSLVGMILLGIATIFVAPAIKMESPGPVFFGQTRIGKNGRRFTCYKFRSMYQDAEERKKELMASNEVKGLMFKMTDDPRITKVGKFIRKTSIDELPQFWNILKGDMSLVGTRPPTVDEFERYETKHKCRLSMTPGLTGLWQISGRSEIKDFDEVVKLDMQYIDNWSILKDVEILIKTVFVVLTRKGSH